MKTFCDSHFRICYEFFIVYILICGFVDIYGSDYLVFASLHQDCHLAFLSCFQEIKWLSHFKMFKKLAYLMHNKEYEIISKKTDILANLLYNFDFLIMFIDKYGLLKTARIWQPWTLHSSWSKTKLRRRVEKKRWLTVKDNKKWVTQWSDNEFWNKVIDSFLFIIIQILPTTRPRPRCSRQARATTSWRPTCVSALTGHHFLCLTFADAQSYKMTKSRFDKC